MATPVFSSERPAKVLAIMPHQDDFEFNVAGTFAQLRMRYGDAVELKVIVTSKGATGHHEMEPDALFPRRMEEAARSAALIGASVECLLQLDGTHVDAQVLVTRNLLGGLWNAIRGFGAHYVFAPPLVSDPMAAVHVDHEETARAVRLVGFQLGVAKAYPRLSTTAEDLGYRPPLIVLCDDGYNAEAVYDVANSIGDTYPTKMEMAKCHVSQVFEWLPFSRGESPPSIGEFELGFRARHTRANERFGLDDEAPREFFRISNWGRRPAAGDIEWLFANASPSSSERGGDV